MGALPKLLTRVDMGCLRNGSFDPWINEVEFVPSLYVEDHNKPVDASLGDQMMRISQQLLVISKKTWPPHKARRCQSHIGDVADMEVPSTPRGCKRKYYDLISCEKPVKAADGL